MQKHLFLLIALLATTSLGAQNIFSNPDFELYSTCPTTQGEASKAIDWVEIIQSADYMNCQYTCWTGQAIVGAQSGTGYMGFASYSVVHATEAIGQTLTTPLVAGATYNIALYAKRSTGPSYSSVCSGVCFYGFPYNPYSSSVVGQCPQDSGVLLACTDTVISDLWQPYSVSFVSPGNYGFIGMSVGCQLTTACGEYVFVDNLVGLVSSINQNQIDASTVYAWQNAGPAGLHVSFKLLQNTNINFSLINMLGQTVFSNNKTMEPGTHNQVLDISNVSNGIYMLKIESDKTRITKKVFIIN